MRDSEAGLLTPRKLRLVMVTALLSVSFGAFFALTLQIAQLRQEHAMPVLDMVAISGLWFCCLGYLINRFGTERRSPSTTRNMSIKPLLETSIGANRHVTVLIPSYCEEPRVIEATLISAALAICPSRNIVVLIDDPTKESGSLLTSIGAVESVRTRLLVPKERFEKVRAAWLKRKHQGDADLYAERSLLANELFWLSEWVKELGEQILRANQACFAHVDRFFVDQVVTPLSDFYREEGLRTQILTSMQSVERLYDMLPSLVCSEISCFHRKTYSNLSHAPNKAMNLNAYISLMGRSFRRGSRMKSAFLKPFSGPRPHLVVRRPDYVMTLDADSIVLPSYLQALMVLIEANSKIAVVQTPYVSFPGSKTPVEQCAGATTDIQYLVHQGSTYFNASFWVGANALIRFEALKSIQSSQVENGLDVPVYVQDKTVIEDTGSTIDLLARGWTVHNHFSALAYSATPSDFGALCIQRKRWSNGGLIILADIARGIMLAPRGAFRPLGLMLRLYYLMSPIIGNCGLFILMISTPPSFSVVIWMALAVLPYFILYSLDLRRMGYRMQDLFAVCSLNLLLLPVAFAGIFESVLQIVLRKKTNFVRTPKVGDRTGVPSIYIIFHVVLMSYMVLCVFRSWASDDLPSVVSPLVNLVLISYGFVKFIGVRNAVFDFIAPLLPLFRPNRVKVKPKSVLTMHALGSSNL